MQVSVASTDDLEFIEGAYECARAFMQANGNATQWSDGYPGRIDAEEDIACEHCFLVSDDEGRLAVFSFAPGPDETYASIDYLRCDTHEDNAPMRRALSSFGFRECGTITVANGTQRVAYDWLKEPLDGGAPASPTTR